jgi:hypothetical protein
VLRAVQRQRYVNVRFRCCLRRQRRAFPSPARRVNSTPDLARSSQPSQHHPIRPLGAQHGIASAGDRQSLFRQPRTAKKGICCNRYVAASYFRASWLMRREQMKTQRKAPFSAISRRIFSARPRRQRTNRRQKNGNSRITMGCKTALQQQAAAWQIPR